MSVYNLLFVVYCYLLGFLVIVPCVDPKEPLWGGKFKVIGVNEKPVHRQILLTRCHHCMGRASLLFTKKRDGIQLNGTVAPGI